MALTITSAGSGTSITNNTTLTITGVTASVGDVLLLCIAAGNSGTGGAAAVISSIADDAGGSTNVYSQRGTTGLRNAMGTPNTGSCQYFFECPVTTALSGATITITFSANNPEKAVQCYRIQPGSGESVSFISVGTANNGASTSPTATTVSVTSGHTIFGMVAMETDDAVTGDSDTTNGNWSAVLTRLADNGSDADSMTCSSQHKTVNATGNQSWGVSGLGANRGFVANTIIYAPVRKLTADAGSYTLTGTAASLEFGRKVVANAGSYTLSGQTVSLERGYLLTAAAGSYSISGQDADLIHDDTGITLVADAGAYSLTGSAASLLIDRLLTAASGSYSLTGSAASLLRGYEVAAEAGVYALTGQSAGFRLDRVLSANTGSYTLTGSDTGLVWARIFVAPSGSYELTGATVTLTFGGSNIEYVSPGHERCMRCGFIRGLSKLRKEWTGLLVCEDTCWEPQHPQMTMRGVPDDQTVPWKRPEPAPVFLDPNDVQAGDL